MEIVQKAVSGTMESCDVMVSIMPGDGTRQIRIESQVAEQFYDAILHTVEDMLDSCNIRSVSVEIFDRGAFDFTIRARLESAIEKAGRRQSPC